MDSLILTDEEYGFIEFDTKDFVNEKDYNKFISVCKKLVRSSYEYRQWTKFVKDTKGSECYFTRESGNELTIEVHHHPYTLYDLITIVLYNHLSNENYSINSLDISKEVVQLHYRNLVGYIPLIKSLHEKYHNGFLNIPINLVEGNWKELSKFYEIPEDIKIKVTKLASITLDTDIYSWSKDNYLYIQKSKKEVA